MADRVEDIVQSAMEKLVRRIEDEGVDAPPASYLWKMANHAVIDEIRRHRRRREVAMDDAREVDERGARSDPEALTAARQTGEAIDDCLTRLGDDRRLVVSLYLAGNSVPESAGMLAWKRKRVENLVYRGLADLRLCLENKGLRP